MNRRIISIVKDLGASGLAIIAMSTVFLGHTIYWAFIHTP